MKPYIRLTALRFVAAVVLLLAIPTILVGGFAALIGGLPDRTEDGALAGNASAGSATAGVGGTGASEPLTVILDPGHGGMDGGAVSVTGALEKDLNLQMAMQLRAMLQASGVRVIMTRTSDTMLDSDVSGGRKMKDLSARLAIMKEHPNALFVSIHMNRFSSPSSRGTQIWYAPASAEAKELADTLAAAVRASLQPDNTRLSKKADENIFLLHRASGCAVLVECGFLSNPEEAALLADATYRDRLAAALNLGILTSLGKREAEIE